MANECLKMCEAHGLVFLSEDHQIELETFSVDFIIGQ